MEIDSYLTTLCVVWLGFWVYYYWGHLLLWLKFCIGTTMSEFGFVIPVTEKLTTFPPHYSCKLTTIHCDSESPLAKKNLRGICCFISLPSYTSLGVWLKVWFGTTLGLCFKVKMYRSRSWKISPPMNRRRFLSILRSIARLSWHGNMPT